MEWEYLKFLLLIFISKWEVHFNELLQSIILLQAEDIDSGTIDLLAVYKPVVEVTSFSIFSTMPDLSLDSSSIYSLQPQQYAQMLPKT